MKTGQLLALSFVAAVAVAACDQLTTVQPPDGDVFDAPVEGLTTSELAASVRGDAEFGRPFSPNAGLGPIFNDVSCAACHSGDGRGQLRNALHRIGDASNPHPARLARVDGAGRGIHPRRVVRVDVRAVLREQPGGGTISNMSWDHVAAGMAGEHGGTGVLRLAARWGRGTADLVLGRDGHDLVERLQRADLVVGPHDRDQGHRRGVPRD